MKVATSLVSLLLASAVWAQAPEARPAPAPASALSPFGDESAASVPDDKKLERSTRTLARIRDVLRDGLGKLEEARRTQDVVKLNCVNEKVTQLKGLLRISEQADASLRAAIAERDSLTSDHEYTKLMIAGQKVDDLRVEAEECIGQLAFRTDENLNVQIEEPDTLPGGDPTDTPAPGDVDNRPPPASPTL